MAITSSIARFLAAKKKEYGFKGKAITFGRQDICASYQQINNLLGTNFSETGKVVPDDFFQALGFKECQDIDKFDPDNPKILADLNYDLPKDLWRQFDWVFDSGTSEHCFNTPKVLENVVNLLKLGGGIIHACPSLGYSNHGFYSFQPSLYYSYYSQNGFADFECYLMELTKLDYCYNFNSRARCMKVDDIINLPFFTKNNVMIIFKAIKKRQVEKIEYPIQSFCKLGRPELSKKWLKNIEGKIPLIIRPFMRECYLRYRRWKGHRKLLKGSFYI